MSFVPFTDVALTALLADLEAEDFFVFLETTRVSAENRRSYLFRRPRRRLRCLAGDDPEVFFAEVTDALRKGCYLAGWFAYEFGYLLEPVLNIGRPARFETGDVVLADLGVYDRPQIFDHQAGAVPKAGPGAALSDAGSARYAVSNLRPNQEQAAYRERLRAIKSYIAAGDTYQVNYTLKLCFDFDGSAAALYRTLRRNQSVAYAAYIRNGDQQVLSFSPELFFRKEGTVLTVRPMKGTIGRGRTPAEDLRQVDFLRDDMKNRSENVMIVDLLRNDLGRLCPTDSAGNVRVESLFDVETYETLHQMTSTIRATVRPDISLFEMFRALFPCGSVTGAPKIRTMEIIRSLETENRGVYTGAIGFFAPDGDAVFNVPIRTVVLNGDRGEMGIGSGIVWDSDPDREWEECRLKGDFLVRPVPEFQLIETILWQSAEGYWLLGLHLERLAASARYFNFQFEMKKINALLAEAAAGFAGEDQAGGRRVRLTLAKEGGIEVTCRQWPLSTIATTNGTLPRVRFSEKSTDSRSPYLYHKTTLRRLYEEEYAQVSAQGFFEMFFVNERGEVTEGSFTNIFIERNGVFFTPAESCGLLPGVFRRHFLDSGTPPVREAVLSRQDVEQADAVYAGNSVRGLVRVELA